MFIFFPHLVQWFNNSSPLMTSFKNHCYGHQKSTKAIPPGGPSSVPGCRALPVGVLRAEGTARPGRSPPSPTRNDGPPHGPPTAGTPWPSSHTRLRCPSPAELGPDVSSRLGNVIPREPWEAPSPIKQEMHTGGALSASLPSCRRRPSARVLEMLSTPQRRSLRASP